MTWIARWLRLPHDAQVPDTLDLATFAVAGGKEPARQRLPGALRGSGWYETARHRPVRSGSLQWTCGWTQEPSEQPTPQPTVIAVAASGDDREVQRYDLGPGGVTATAAGADGALLVAVGRRGWGPHGTADAPVEVLRLSPTGERGVLLPAESVDISGHRWPLVPRPPEADSYVRQILDSWGELGLAPVLSAARLRLVGEWPGTQLECSFDVPSRPGLRLRRRIPLFDELGRTADPRHAGTHRLETVETGGLPPSSAAVDGVLDV